MIVSLSDFSFAYNPDNNALVVPKLDIAAGEKIALVGRNGSGKSTLLHCLSGVFEASSGKRACRVEPQKVALVFQTPCLDKKLTVLENLLIFGKVWGLKRAQIEHRTMQLAQLLDLESLLQKTVGSLSGGQQRRADLARALLSEPEILFLDEPTTGLDVVAQREFWALLAQTKNLNPALTLICASHHAAELGLFERFLFLEQGRVELDVKREELLSKLPPETLEITTFQAQQVKEFLQQALSLAVTEPMHNKLLIHVDEAEAVVSKLKLISGVHDAIEATTIRKTNLADVVLRQLFSTHEAVGAGTLIESGANR
ncbi:MAG: ABC transporter ATP-binding protein [Betaproteobacteria bacterium]|nr:ABC transporter ATP-binding protein [Betaproteobacteria bacterium]